MPVTKLSLALVVALALLPGVVLGQDQPRQRGKPLQPPPQLQQQPSQQRQPSQQQPVSAAERNLSMVMQQLIPAVTLYAEEMARKLAEQQVRIAELEKLCGDACKKAGN